MLLHHLNHTGKGILRKQLPCLHKLRNLQKRFFKLFLFICTPKLPFQYPGYLRGGKGLWNKLSILSVQNFCHIIAQIIHHMNRTAVYIQDDIVSVILILMNHICSSYEKQRPLRPLSLKYSHIIPIIFFAHMSGFLLYRMSYMLTGRMSGTRRIRFS